MSITEANSPKTANETRPPSPASEGAAPSRILGTEKTPRLPPQPLCPRAERQLSDWNGFLRNRTTSWLRKQEPFFPLPIETFRDIEVAALHLLDQWRRLLEDFDHHWENLAVSCYSDRSESCPIRGCYYHDLMDVSLSRIRRGQKGVIDAQDIENQQCPFCSEALYTQARIRLMQETASNLRRAVAHLLPDTYFDLETLHLGVISGAPRPDPDTIAGWNGIPGLTDTDAGERDWHRVLKAATLARERQESKGIEGPGKGGKTVEKVTELLRAETKLRRPYTSDRELGTRFGCSPATVKKAIMRHADLRTWKRKTRPATKPRVETLTPAVIDRTPAPGRTPAQEAELADLIVQQRREEHLEETGPKVNRPAGRRV